MRSIIAKLTLLAAVTLLSLMMIEGVMRLIIDPVDVLVPVLLKDDVLRWRVEPGSAGHDQWGYRNEDVPESVDLIAIGDSQTYGSGTPAVESWPAWLGRESNRSVYNLSLNGFGPVDYMALVEQKALSLSPEHIFVGLYLGNDLVDAWRSVYTMEHWAAMRDPEFAVTEQKPESEQVMPVSRQTPGTIVALIGPFRAWLRHNSVAYRALATGLGDRLRGSRLQNANDAELRVSVLRDENGDVVTSLDPRYRFQAVDFEDLRVAEGIRLSIEAMRRMSETAAAAGVGFTVVVIPTKTRVFAPDLRAQPGIRDAELIDRLIENESRAESEIIQGLEANRVDFVSPLAALQAARADGIYPKGEDGHPNAKGYHVIARVAAATLTGQP